MKTVFCVCLCTYEIKCRMIPLKMHVPVYMLEQGHAEKAFSVYLTKKLYPYFKVSCSDSWTHSLVRILEY